MKKLISGLLAFVMVFTICALSPRNETVTLANEDTLVSLLPTADTYAQSGDANAGLNFGSAATLMAAYTAESGLGINSGYTEYGAEDRGALGSARNIFMRFNIGDIDTAAVKRATLRLTISGVNNIGSTNAYDVLSTTMAVFATGNNSWQENTLTWSNAPAPDGSAVAVSQPVSSANSASGNVLEIDLTKYIRKNAPSEGGDYSFIIMANAAGVSFHSKEAANEAYRPALDIVYNNVLSHSTYVNDVLLEEAVADSANDAYPSAAPRLLSVASKGGTTAADSNMYTYVQLEVPKSDLTLYDYALARFTLRLSAVEKGAQTLSLYPVSDNDWTARRVKWSDKPSFSSTPITTATVKNDLSAPFTYVTFDVTEYIRTNAHPDGIYSFAITADSAKTSFYSSSPALSNMTTALFIPSVDFIYMPKSAVEVCYVDETGTEIAPSALYHHAIGDTFSLSDFPMALDNRTYFYSSALTAQRNPLTLTVSENAADNTIYLVYQKKSLLSAEDVTVTALINDIPSLSDSIDLIFDNNTSEAFRVDWQEISSAMVAQSGKFTVIGTLPQLDNSEVYANVTVLDVREIRTPLVTTAPKSAPLLPTSLSVVFEDGSEEGALYSLPVTWDEVSAAAYEKVGSFIAMGVIDRIGTHTQLTVLVEEGDIESYTAAASTFTAENKPNDVFFQDRENNQGVLRISGNTEGIDGAALTNRKAFVRFNTPDYPDAEDEYALDDIVNARVRLYFQSINNTATPNFKIYGILPENDTWDEDMLTWNNQGDFIRDAEYITTLSINQATFEASWVEFDVTSFVRAHRHVGEAAFYIEADTCASVAASRLNSAYAPTLTVSRYIPDTAVTVRRVCRVNNTYEDIAPVETLTGKLGKSYEYPYAFDDCIAYPPYDNAGVYYYNSAASSISIDALAEEGNTLYIVYDALDIESVDTISVDTFAGKFPALPDNIGVTLESGGDFPASARTKSKAVVWDKDSVSEIDYATRGTFTIYGAVEHTSIKAKATVNVSSGYAESTQSMKQGSLEIDLNASSVYRLSFTLENKDTIPAKAADINIYDGNDILSTVYKMSKADFLEYLSTFENGSRVELYFETPESNALCLRLPENTHYLCDATLSQITQANADLHIDYVYNGETISSKLVNAPLGSTFTLSEDDFYPNSGYIVSSLGSPSAINSLTASLKLDALDMVITLNCAYDATFAAEHYITNTVDIDGVRHTIAKAALFNGTSDPHSAVLIVAKFDSEGNFVALEKQSIALSAAQSDDEEYALDITLTGDEFANAYLWSDFGTLSPLSLKIDSRNPDGISEAPECDFITIPATARYAVPSTYQEGNEISNMLTRNLSTRWSAQATADTPVNAVIDLNGVYSLHTIGLAFYNGASRRSIFALDTSEDGESWVTVIPKRQSSGRTSQIEYYTFNSVNARYVKLLGWGWEAASITNNGLETKSDTWFSVTAFEAYGVPVSLPDALLEASDWNALSGHKLTASELSSNAFWGAASLDEETYTDYTPSLGTNLYADFTEAPEAMQSDYSALHIYDNAGRYDENSDSAGAVGVYRKYSVNDSNYLIKFKWYVPTQISGSFYSPDWAGVTLSSGRPSGGADNTHSCALQLRLSPSGRSNMTFKSIRSTMFNDGSMSDLLGNANAFGAGKVWNVELKVREDDATVEVTINDGSVTETAVVNFNNLDSERTKTENWYSNKLNYITFSSGAGGKSEMYISDFSLSALEGDEKVSGDETVLISDALSEYESGDVIEEGTVGSIFTAPIIESADAEYKASLGSRLYADVRNMPTAAGMGSNTLALHMYDNVARETNTNTGSGGEFVYVDIGSLDGDNVYDISFNMYAPTAGEYSGFALGRGANAGGDDTLNPLALQVRFSPQTSGMQFNYYNSIQYNKGSQSALVGTGSNRFKYNNVWKVTLSYNPVLSQITVKVSDGSVTQSQTVSIPTSGNGSFKNDWSKNRINKLIFNTGAGTSSDIYVSDISVTDTGVEKISQKATGGAVRFENVQSNGSFLVFSPYEGTSPTFRSGTNPYYTRFIERRGLYDSECVSLEPLNMPGYFLCVNSDWSVTIRKSDDSEAFRKAATFYKVHALGVSNSDGFSYKSLLKSAKGNDLYLYNNNSTLRVTNYSSDTFKPCSFYVRDESSAYVSDSFRGNKISSQWYKGYPWYTNYHNHSGVARDSNIVVANGNVNLIATDERGKWIKNSAGKTGYQDSINNVWRYYKAYVGVISINSKVFNKGSYLEGSFRQPASSKGYWTAFWLNGRDSWPPETDIFEFLSSKGGYTWYTATHGGSEGAGWEYCSSDLRNSWNTFTLDWGYDYMKMYVNGSLYFTAPDISYQKNMYLILNTGMGAWESEPDDSTTWNTGLQLQWIRTYQYY